jgi:hypothetical protein
MQYLYADVTKLLLFMLKRSAIPAAALVIAEVAVRTDEINLKILNILIRYFYVGLK